MSLNNVFVEILSTEGAGYNSLGQRPRFHAINIVALKVRNNIYCALTGLVRFVNLINPGLPLGYLIPPTLGLKNCRMRRKVPVCQINGIRELLSFERFAKMAKCYYSLSYWFSNS